MGIHKYSKDFQFLMDPIMDFKQQKTFLLSRYNKLTTTKT